MVEKMVATPALQLADVFPPFADLREGTARRASAATPASAAEAHATSRPSRFRARSAPSARVGRARLSRVSTTRSKIFRKSRFLA